MAVQSIQADPAAQRRIGKSRRAGRSQVQALNDECLRHAFNHQRPWENDDVGTLVNMVSGDHTTFDMARTLGRSYYATAMARQHIGFCLRHPEAFRKVLEQ
jgi:hypothetical protein